MVRFLFLNLVVLVALLALEPPAQSQEIEFGKPTGGTVSSRAFDGQGLQTEIANYALVPIHLLTSPLVASAGSKDQGKSGELQPRHVIGYVGAYATLKGVNRIFFETSRTTYLNKSKGAMNKAPKKVIYISAFPRGNVLQGVSHMTFLRLFRDHPNAQFVEVDSLADLVQKLRALPQDSSIDRIELDLHGDVGILGFPDGSIMQKSDIHVLEDASLKLTAPQAEIRITSCLVAADSTSGAPAGREFLLRLGRSLLPEGGKVIASQKLVTHGEFPLSIMRHLFGAEIPMQLQSAAQNWYRVGFPRGFKPRKDYIEVKIPPKHPIGTCWGDIQSILKDLLE